MKKSFICEGRKLSEQQICVSGVKGQKPNYFFFNLQKTTPTPSVSTSKAYLRQLWTCNLAVLNLQAGSAHFFMRHEGQASRGCQEISSCLLKFIKSLSPDVKHIGSGFQRQLWRTKQKPLHSRVWMYIVRNTNIETIDQRFFVSGHSFNEDGQDFGLIELKKKKTKRDLYVPQHYMDLVTSTSRKFITVKMEDDEFVDLDILAPFFKKAVTGIQSMQWLHFQKDKPFTLNYKNTAGNEMEVFSDFSSPRTGKIPNALPDLLPNVKRPSIKQAKYSNLTFLWCNYYFL